MRERAPWPLGWRAQFLVDSSRQKAGNALGRNVAIILNNRCSLPAGTRTESLGSQLSTCRVLAGWFSPGCTRRGIMQRVREGSHRPMVHPLHSRRAERTRYFAKLKRKPHAIQARANARTRQTHARTHARILRFRADPRSPTEISPAIGSHDGLHEL